MSKIVEFTKSYQNEVVKHILDIQNNELRLGLSLEDQPDLLSIEENYQKTGGNFWIAIDHDKVVGTIGLYNLGQNTGDLRKMFVKPDYRGPELGTSKSLLNILIKWTIDNNFENIFLETNSAFKAAIKFYHKNGFKKVEKRQLPPNFPIMKVAESFFVYEIKQNLQNIMAIE